MLQPVNDGADFVKILFPIDDKLELVVVTVDKLLHDGVIEPALFMHGGKLTLAFFPWRRVGEFGTQAKSNRPPAV